VDDRDLLDQLVEHRVLGAVRVDEVVAAHLGLGLQRPVDAAVALLHARRVPRHVDVEQIGAVVLEVEALARGVGRDEDAHRVLVGIAVERLLDRSACLVAHAAMEDRDAIGALAVVHPEGVEAVETT